MSKEFKPGDLIFLVNRANEILLAKFESYYGHNSVEAIDIISNIKYWGFGYATTPENRQALITLYGEDTVPKLPLRGSELTKEILKNQNYVLCWTAVQSDDIARRYKELNVIEYAGSSPDWFICIQGYGYKHAVPVNMCGNEITEIPDD